MGKVVLGVYLDAKEAAARRGLGNTAVDIASHWHLRNNRCPGSLVKEETAIEIVFNECLSV